MNQYLLTIVLTLFSLGIAAQQIFVINDFSDQYYAKMEVDTTYNEVGHSSVEVYNQIDNKLLISADSLFLNEYYLDDSYEDTISYDKQNILTFSDINFDEIEDISILVGPNGCRGAMTSRFYLADKEGNFIYNKELTQLDEEACGNLEINTKNKTYSAYDVGPTWWYSSKSVLSKDNQVRKISEIRKNTTGCPYDYVTITKNNWEGNTKKSEIHKYLTDGDEGWVNAPEILYSFRIKNTNKWVILFEDCKRNLTYALLKNMDKMEVEFISDARFDFKKQNRTTTLTFVQQGVQYQLSETKAKVEIKVVDGSTTKFMKGVKSTQNGTLEKLKDKTIF